MSRPDLQHAGRGVSRLAACAGVRDVDQGKISACVGPGRVELAFRLGGATHDPGRLARTIMNPIQTNTAYAEAEALRLEVDALRGQLAGLSEASIAISGNLETEAALQEVVNSA